jgi:hypothetical protein
MKYRRSTAKYAKRVGQENKLINAQAICGMGPDSCSRAPHYADDIPKDDPTEKTGAGEVWMCPECNREFILVEDWRTWKRDPFWTDDDPTL